MARPSIYLDYAASAPLRPEVALVMRKIERAGFGNASSIHSVGRAALNLIDQARADIAQVLNCRADELLFTSGGTESDNLVIKGIAAKHARGHIVTTAIEHAAILESCRALEAAGYSVTYIKPDKSGVITSEQIAAAIRDNTVLVSVMYVNNETGMIQPIAAIGEMIAATNSKREQKILFHTDGVQAANLLDLDVAKLGVDLMTLSAHKVGGPKGVGVLYAKSGINLSSQIDGGGQQRGVRSGTLNTMGIVGLAAALTKSQSIKERESKRLTDLQTRLVQSIRDWPGITLNGDMHHRLPSVVNFSVREFKSDTLVIGCDLAGIAVSAASACASGSIQPSYVLAAMDTGEEVASGSLRISMGYKTNRRDIDRLVATLDKLIHA